MKLTQEQARSSGLSTSEIMLAFDREQLFAGVRPRLLRLARLRGVAPDALEDVVQETLLLAWKLIDRLHTPQHFHLWVEEICRNICYRYLRASHRDTARYIPLFALSGSEEMDTLDELLPEGNLATEQLDPAEMLSRAEITTVLKQALGRLPEGTREVVELYYLLEMPQREAALRLGLSISALETRLYRARHQLRQILNGDLRKEAESIGLPLDSEQAMGWRATSLWCYYCGNQRLHGTFETTPEGLRYLHMRCPQCSESSGLDIINGSRYAYLDKVRSFQPAFKRTVLAVSSFLMEAITKGTAPCCCCEQATPIRVQGPHQWSQKAADSPARRQFWISGLCPKCGEKAGGFSIDDAIYWSTPIIQQFIRNHPRWLNEPDAAIDYQGQPAILLRLSDRLSSARMDVIVHRETLRILAVFQT